MKKLMIFILISILCGCQFYGDDFGGISGNKTSDGRIAWKCVGEDKVYYGKDVPNNNFKERGSNKLCFTCKKTGEETCVEK